MMKQHLKQHLLKVLWVAVTLLFAASVSAKSVNQKAPEITLPGMTGKTVKLSDFRGQVVMVNFWASWCEPCRTEMPLIEDIYNKYKKIGFTVLGVNVDENPKAGKKMLKDIPVSFPVVFDSDNKMIEKYEVQAMPSTYMVDRKGNIRDIHRGYKKGDEKAYENYIRKLLRE
ncbi:MAG: TlpA family protein disulfide reductase [Pseudomonadales bacterium]|nr:TlpA family protein disulfide reductase [Pseudomonadales bacterium]